MKILVFDNYDSFTYNLVHLLQKLGAHVEVFRNDAIPLEDVAAYDKILLSPGPGIPSEAGSLLPLIREYASSKPILGVCLGHQAIGEAFGGSLTNLPKVYHGIATPVTILSSGKGTRSRLFEGMSPVIEAGRYHSWIVNENDLPAELEITARDEEGMIMGLQHRSFDVQGVQFHPESVLTPEGETILRNWIRS
jgi:anthranilate synthase component 2